MGPLKITQKCDLNCNITLGYLIMFFECIVTMIIVCTQLNNIHKIYLSKVQIHIYIKNRKFKHIFVKYICRKYTKLQLF